MRFPTLRALLPAALLGVMFLAAGCGRGQPRETRPLVLIPDLEVQKKYRAQGMGPFFADGRAMRTPPPGTVARGTLREDDAFTTARPAGPGTELLAHNPLPMTRVTLERGQERYGIYCAPCHGATGAGKGIVVGYGLVPPPSFHDERLRAAPEGHFFDVITNGVRTMPPYARQISPADRWAIVAYLRALQRSQNATLADVPPDAMGEMR
jgi:hypothetical protein